jgi:hypothetical protein
MPEAFEVEDKKEDDNNKIRIRLKGSRIRKNMRA